MPAPKRRRAAEQHDEEHENSERWLLTYADMITLLMVLFIVMFAISQVDKQKFAALADGLKHQLNGGSAQVVPGGKGILDGGKTINQDNGKLDNDPTAPVPDVANPSASSAEAAAAKKAAMAAQRAQLEKAKAKIEATLKAQGLSSSVRFQETQRGLVVSIVTDNVLFDTAQATLKPTGRNVINAIVPALRELPNNISVEGHTDGRPISNTEFPTNWELSVIRATTVLRYLQSQGIGGKRLSATGYGFERPVADNSTAAGRALNRRVELVILSTALTPAEDDAAVANASASIGGS